MAKLFFTYGPMGSAKTAKAIITAYNYEENGVVPLILTSVLDNRYGKNVICSRIGALCMPAVALSADTDILQLFFAGSYGVVVVDEAQFLTDFQVWQLAAIVDTYDIDVFAYGIRSDFRGNLFEGTSRLMAIADTIREERAKCSCGKKATINARIVDGQVMTSGPQILVGGNESYRPMCRGCWSTLSKE